MDNLRSKTNSNFPTTVHTEYQRIIDQYLRVIIRVIIRVIVIEFSALSYSIYANTFVRASLDGIYIYSKYIWRVAAAISRILNLHTIHYKYIYCYTRVFLPITITTYHLKLVSPA